MENVEKGYQIEGVEKFSFVRVLGFVYNTQAGHSAQTFGVPFSTIGISKMSPGDRLSVFNHP